MSIDKILNSTIKALLVIIISIMLTIGALFVIPPHFAYADSFDSQPLYTGDTLPVYQSGNNTRSIYIVDGTDVYVFFLNDATANSGPSFYLASSVQQTVQYRRADYTSGSTSISLTQSSDNLYYNQGDGTFSWGTNNTTYLLPSFDSVDSALASIESSIQTGEFLSLSQDSYTSTFDFDTIKTFGAWIYSGYNIYSLYGSYNTAVSPTSQYCYINNGDNTYSCAVFSSVPLTVYVAFVNGETYTYYVCSQYDVGKYYYVVNQNVDISGLNVQPFDSLESAQSAFSGASSGGGSGSASGVVSAGAITLTVPAGNVLYVRPRAGSLAKLTVIMPYKSNTYSPYWDRTQSNVYWLSGVSSLPDSNTIFPLSGMTNINWSLDENSVDGYGRGYNGYVNHAAFNSGWFVVYNPLYTLPISKGNDNSLSINPTVTVQMQYATEYYIYDLNEHITSSGGSSSSLTDYETYEYGIYDSSSDTVNTSSTLPNGEAVTGGQQQEVISTDLSFSDYFHIFTETLTEFTNSVVNIFTAPISHIAQLISSGSSFMIAIGQFFTWLPEPVYHILVSALVVAVAVGVLKLLL